VVLVTNAQAPWVETACRNFLPGLLPLLGRIPVRYAHAVYKGLGLGGEDSVPAAMRSAASELQAQARGESLGTAGTAGTGEGLGAPGMYTPAGSAGSARRSAQSATGEANSKNATSASLSTEGQSDGLDRNAYLTGLTSATGLTSMTGSFEVAPQLWKEAAFQQECAGFYGRYEGQSWKNVVSVGDAVFERDALRAVSAARPTKTKRCRTKTVKMLDEPAIEDLIKQVKVIHDAISMIASYDGNLDIQINAKDLNFDVEVIEKMMEDR